jgi:hypothetical protein
MGDEIPRRPRFDSNHQTKEKSLRISIFQTIAEGNLTDQLRD